MRISDWSSDVCSSDLKAVSGGVHLLTARDRLDCVQRGHWPKPEIGFEIEVSVLFPGIVPGEHEDGEALIRQPAHERILGREIEDIVFNDPGGAEDRKSTRLNSSH